MKLTDLMKHLEVVKGEVVIPLVNRKGRIEKYFLRHIFEADGETLIILVTEKGKTK